jgi:hypothetical protein
MLGRELAIHMFERELAIQLSPIAQLGALQLLHQVLKVKHGAAMM